MSKAPATLFWDDRQYLANDLGFAHNVDSFACISLERIEDYNAWEKTFYAVFKDYDNGKLYKVLYKKNIDEPRSESFGIACK
jgi:lysine/ornithine N-monooxygenase